MGTFWKWAVVLVVAGVWVATAWPQERVVPEGTTVKLLLLRQKSVQKELEVTPDATRKIMTFTNAQSEAARKASEMGDAQRKKAYEKLEKQNQQFLASTLTAKQSKRLEQISLQFNALEQLTKPEMARTLELTKEQQQKFKELQKEARKELADLIRENPKGRNEKFAALREKTRTKILAILKDEQEAKVREMAGPSFKGEIVFEEHESPKDK